MKTCLLVDDSRVIRKVARQIFEAMDFSCEEAEHGQQAVEFCQKSMPDVILLDWNMPVMDGLEFLRVLRKMPNGGGAVVVFCTTENDMKHIQEAMTNGANEYIMKPFDADIVRSKLFQLGIIDE
ncbi:MAG: response regulator [Proteobacteria bacterium]|jgi:two-component system chemotaxis response regulator CheY|nr:response regulator [Alphaproteobacteria bacterium]NCC03168.1 response regulator [Pseudomonadota bacterium]